MEIDNPEVLESINHLSTKLDQFSNALNTASEELKSDVGVDSVHEELKGMLKEIISQNQKIAQGIVEILHLLKRRQPMPGPRPMPPQPPVPPRPMFPQGSQQMQPRPMQQPMPMPGPRPQRMMPKMNLPPPPMPGSPGPKKPKKSLSLFSR